jgi:hypothetical protein
VMHRKHSAPLEPERSGCFDSTNIWPRWGRERCLQLDRKLIKERGIRVSPRAHRNNVAFSAQQTQYKTAASNATMVNLEDSDTLLLIFGVKSPEK